MTTTININGRRQLTNGYESDPAVRAERAKTARELRARGYSFRAIGAQLSISHTEARRLTLEQQNTAPVRRGQGR